MSFFFGYTFIISWLTFYLQTTAVSLSTVLCAAVNVDSAFFLLVFAIGWHIFNFMLFTLIVLLRCLVSAVHLFNLVACECSNCFDLFF